MAWPPSGTNGWEAFGTEITTEPERWPLPVVRVGYYFDPTRLNGVGALAQDSIVLTYHGGTVVVRRRSGSAEAEFRLPYVWSDGLLDTMVIEDFDPCAIVADIYADDGETILWSVGTSPRHPNPYLMEPEQYAEQEIDPASGGATLGTLTLTVVDKAQTAGDQDSGWMTAKLAEVGIANLAGRRVRVRRWVDPELSYYVLADGPASIPRLDQYAGISFSVRDTREKERLVRLFDQGIEQSLLPEGSLDGYFPDDSDLYLVPPVGPVVGEFNLLAPPFDYGFVTLTGYNDPALLEISFPAWQAIQTYSRQAAGVDSDEWVNVGPIWARWRLEGSGDPWTEVRADLSVYLVTSSPVPSDPYQGRARRPDGRVEYVTPTRQTVTVTGFSFGPGGMPPDGSMIEIQIIGPRGVPPSEEYPIWLEGLTAGQFAKRVYDGFYSVRGPDASIVPTGIRYDEAALLQMTEPIHAKFTEPIDDARAWLESALYAPTGWVPALDDFGRISPVSQAAPVDATGLTVLNDAVTEPSSEWSAGQRVINVIRYTYPRDYISAEPETAGEVVTRQIVLEFVDAVSVERFGRQVLEIDGSLFRALGNVLGDPISGDTSLEQGFRLGEAKQIHILNRYAFGAPAISVAVMRRMTTGLRAGSWVVVDLSWLPDYITQRRGLIGLGQVVALGDLDCAWRQVLLEMVTPLALPAS